MEQRSRNQQTQRPPSYDPRLNIYDQQEVNFWARQFGVSEAQLLNAVESVGTNIEAVRDQLNAMSTSQARMFWHRQQP
jgi:hypothetical protein